MEGTQKRKLPNGEEEPNKKINSEKAFFTTRKGVVIPASVLAGLPKFTSPPPLRVPNRPGIPVVVSKDLIVKQKAYFEKYSKLTQMVLDDELQDIHGRLAKAWSSKEAKKWLQKEGLTLFNLRAKKVGQLFNEVTVKFTLRSQKGEQFEPFLPYHKFSRGDMVMLSESSKNPLENSVMDGFIAEKSKKFIQVTFTKVPDDLESRTWRIDRSANRVTYERTMTALKTLCSVRDPPPAPGTLTIPRTSVPAVPDMNGGTLLKELILGNVRDAEASAALPPQNLHGFYSNTRYHPPDFNSWLLNDSQRETIRWALNRRLAMIQGPPGTGKTHTAVHLVRFLVHVFSKASKQRVPILCAADTNVAVDNLLEGLANHGVNVLRIGKPVKIREEFRNRSVEGQMAEHADYTLLTDKREAAEKMQRQILNGAELADDLTRLRTEISQIENKIYAQITSQTEVICCTCIGSGHMMLEGGRFPVVVIDEATQATEPATLCALTKHSEHVIMLGDHYQLPPTVTSPRAAEGGLGESLFQRMVGENVKANMLQIQYRMNPIISQFPSQQFYEGKVTNGVTVDSFPPAPKGFKWPNAKKPIAFVSIDSREEGHSLGMTKTKANRMEAETVVSIVDQLLEGGELSAKDIGILTPYGGQVKLITELLDKKGGTSAGKRYHKITVHTIDGFQGREKEVIIFSTVRANDEGNLGFLKDWRRLNVALTRAKRAEIIIGHEKTLEKDAVWSKWLSFVKENDLVINKDDI